MRNPNQQRPTKAGLFGLALMAGAMTCSMTGCGAGNLAASAPVQVTVEAHATGIFMGGQQPVGNVAIKIYQTSATYGGASTADSSTFYTTASGNFTLPTFTCTSGTQLFMVGTGGQPIVGTTNNNLALMTALGPCSTFSSSAFINVNELTSVATIFALSPFLTNAVSIGAPASNATGLANAFAVINQIVNTTNGTLPGPNLPATATLPIAQINTLADIMEQCVNSAGGTATDTSTGCGKLFSLTPNSSGTAPTDTLTAIINIARLPAQNVAALNNLRSASPVFTPALSVNTPPNAWTLAMTYAAPGLSTPTAVATDAAGNVWVTNKGTSSVTKLDYTGTQTFNVTTNYSSPSAIAIDLNGNAWVTNAGNNTLLLQPSGGGSPTIYSGNGLTSPKAVSIDGNGNVIVTNSSSVSTFTSTGTTLNAPYTGVSAPIAAVPTPR